MVDRYLVLKAQETLGFLLREQLVHICHRVVVVGVADDVLHFLPVPFVTHLENHLLRAHLSEEVSDHRGVFGDISLVLRAFTVLNAQVIHHSDCEYALLEVLEFEHVFGICGQESLLDFAKFVGSCIGLKHVFAVDFKCTNGHDSWYAK